MPRSAVPHASQRGKEIQSMEESIVLPPWEEVVTPRSVTISGVDTPRCNMTARCLSCAEDREDETPPRAPGDLTRDRRAPAAHPVHVQPHATERRNHAHET